MAGLEKIVSGGQTGVDRGALDAALERQFPCGGWCPKGRLAEDGPIDKAYPLNETPTANYPERTELNIRFSDGTLILTEGPLTGGTALTERLAIKHGRPVLVIELSDPTGLAKAHTWIMRKDLRILNVAGPRESGSPGIQERSRRFIVALLGNNLDAVTHA